MKKQKGITLIANKYYISIVARNSNGNNHAEVKIKKLWLEK